jgi:NAD dependent epimerase/dehydratase family enzyme
MLIVGGNGMIGRCFTQKLIDSGHKNIHWLVRSDVVHPPGVQLLKWNIDASQIDNLDGIEHVAYVAGYPLAKGRLNDRHKKLCEDSRIKGVRLVAKGLGGRQLQTLIGASAVGIYGWNVGSAPRLENETPVRSEKRFVFSD